MAGARQRDLTTIDFKGANRNAIRSFAAEALVSRGISDEGRIEEVTDGVVRRLQGNPSPLPGLVDLGEAEAPARLQVLALVEEELVGRANGHNGVHQAPASGRAPRARRGRGSRAAAQGQPWDPSQEPEPALAPNALAVLQGRYLAKNQDGALLETPKELFLRVARAVAEGERPFGAPETEVAEWAHRFYGLMASLRWLPNSPTLVNAGKAGRGSLSACFVISPEDSMDSIMQVAYDAAMIEKWGGGIGFGLSKLRPKGDPIATTHGMACGPVAVMKLYSAVGATLTQGAFRLGAHMAQLNVSHPDIREFIHAKDDDVSVQNFNISVQVTDAFMKAVEKDGTWDLTSPRTGKIAETVKARALWRELCASAWKTGDPGLAFMDRVWESQPNPQLGLIQTSNPCGEEFLEDYGNCCLGSIDLGKHLKEGAFDWEALEATVRLAVRFLDNVIEVNSFPVPKLREMNLATRRIGLGIMGWADALVDLGIPYDTEDAVELARRVGAFIKSTAWSESERLAQLRGPFPEYERSALKRQGMPPVRHSSVTTIAPTGSISRIADCSSGIEPHFALAWWSNILWKDHAGTSSRFLDAPGPVRQALVADVGEERAEATLRRLAEDPQWTDETVRALLSRHGVRTAMGIASEWHVRMQAAWQESMTNSTSKTINLPNSATVEDVERAYFLAYQLGCKGITIYRDGSKSMQVLETGRTAQALEKMGEPVDLEVVPVVRAIPRERPAVVRGVTERIRAHDSNMYVTINFDEGGKPFELFSTLGKAGGCDSAYLEAISRLTSLALRSGIDADQVVDQLSGITCDPTWDQGVLVRSPADAVALALSRHIGEEMEAAAPPAAVATQIPLFREPPALPAPTPRAPSLRMGSSANRCPDCGSPLVFEEGCMKCYSCGYSRC